MMENMVNIQPKYGVRGPTTNGDTVPPPTDWNHGSAHTRLSEIRNNVEPS